MSASIQKLSNKRKLQVLIQLAKRVFLPGKSQVDLMSDNQLTLGTASILAACYWQGAAVDNKEGSRNSGVVKIVVRIVSPSQVKDVGCEGPWKCS